MEDNIKNFDRAIEQRMNEAEVAPPFGAWNRLASELDAMAPAAPPVPAPAPASVMPGRGLMGFMAGAMLLGVSLATIYLGQRKADLQQETQKSVKVNTAIATPVLATPVAETVAAVKPVVAASMVKRETPVVASKAVHPVITAAIIADTKTANAVSTAPTVENSLPLNSNTEVPAPTQPVSKNAGESASQVYYFPPIDIGAPEKGPAENHIAPAGPKPELAKAPEDEDDDKKIKSSNENKVKFRPKKRHKFTYGKIIRP